MTGLVGRRIDRYEIQQEIGHGGMARVYRAMDITLQRPVAIKVLAPQLSMDPEFAQRFKREAITAANLHHPAIVTTYDVGEYRGLHYIAMEFVQGRTLHAILDDRDALGPGYAVRILEPLCEALDYAHTRGAVHRDVKPHNILIDIEGRVLLTDFGIAQPPPDADTERLTRTGVFVGTPEYISPEQVEARRVDGRSDLYSLGVVAYEIITGRVPFSGATPQLIIAHAQTPPPPPSRIVPHLPPEFDTVLAKALAKKPQHRFDSGAALLQALQAVTEQYGIPLASTPQIADLVRQSESSVGKPTISLGQGRTPAASYPVLAPPAPPQAQPDPPPWMPPQPPTVTPAPGLPASPGRVSQQQQSVGPTQGRSASNQAFVAVALLLVLVLVALSGLVIWQIANNANTDLPLTPTLPIENTSPPTQPGLPTELPAATELPPVPVPTPVPDVPPEPTAEPSVPTSEPPPLPTTALPEISPETVVPDIPTDTATPEIVTPSEPPTDLPTVETPLVETSTSEPVTLTTTIITPEVSIVPPASETPDLPATDVPSPENNITMSPEESTVTLPLPTDTAGSINGPPTLTVPTPKPVATVFDLPEPPLESPSEQPVKATVTSYVGNTRSTLH